MQVAGLSGVLAIAAGSCYSMALLIEYGWSYRVYAWGRNDSGQLGLDPLPLRAQVHGPVQSA